MKSTHRSCSFWKATDIWYTGVALAPIERFLGSDDFTGITLHWLPLPRRFSFIADPFAHRHADGSLTILAEALDYRIKRGEIHYYRLDPSYRLVETGIAMCAATHLSYPYLITHAGEIYMLPEAHRTGKLTLYRATDFPTSWEPVADLLDIPAIDASIIQHQDSWWMFFALPGADGKALRELHIAYADSLFGPWQLHPQNPVRTGLDASRMGGTPFVSTGALYLPVQDCETTYGGAINLLEVTHLSRTEFTARLAKSIQPSAIHPTLNDGMHTLSACGDVTLLDVKKIVHSPMRHVIDWQRRLRRRTIKW